MSDGANGAANVTPNGRGRRPRRSCPSARFRIRGTLQSSGVRLPIGSMPRLSRARTSSSPNRVELGIELVENVLGRFRRRDTACQPPRRSPARRPRRAAECRAARNAPSVVTPAGAPCRLDQRQRRAEIGEHHRDVAGDQVVERRRLPRYGTCVILMPVMLHNSAPADDGTRRCRRSRSSAALAWRAISSSTL